MKLAPPGRIAGDDMARRFQLAIEYDPQPRTTPAPRPRPRPSSWPPSARPGGSPRPTSALMRFRSRCCAATVWTHHDLGSAAYISRGKAVVSAGPLQISGFPGWVGWLFIHIAFLTGYRTASGLSSPCEWRRSHRAARACLALG
jgi:hypothetical protein